jgi:hypothetical protein
MIALSCLFVQLVTLLEPLYSAGRIHHFSFAGEEWVTLAAKLNSELFPGRTSGKSIAAGANNLRVLEKLGVNLFFHFFILQRKR